MKIFKLGLRLWITITSLFSFLAGWVLLAHAPKPNQSSSSQPQTIVTAFPTLPPLPSLSQEDGGSAQNNNFQLQDQPFFSNQQPAFRQRPFFSTGGS